MDEHLVALASNIRRMREVHGLNLGQLARRAGIAPATLFKIERKRTNPTLETLVALSEALSVSVPDLIAMSDEPTVDVVRADTGEDISDSATSVRILKSVLVGSTLVEFHDFTLQAGHSEVSIAHGAGAVEHVLVRSGRLTVGPVGFEAELGPGDYATYPSDSTHRWSSIGKRDARVWIVHTFPRAILPDGYVGAGDGRRNAEFAPPQIRNA